LALPIQAVQAIPDDILSNVIMMRLEMSKIPFIDLQAKERLGSDINIAIQQVLEHGEYNGA